jgi:hypothetical protein
MRKAGADAAGKTLPSGDTLDGRTHDRHVARGEVEHALDRGGIPGRALTFHPAAQSLQHGLGIKGKIGWVHETLSGSFASDAGFALLTKIGGGGFVKSNLRRRLLSFRAPDLG